MTSPAKDPTAVIVMSIFPAGEPGKIRLGLNQRGAVRLSRDEAVWLLMQSAEILKSAQLADEFPDEV